MLTRFAVGLTIVASLIAASAGIAADTPRGAIPFQTVAHRSASGAIPRQPGIVIAGNAVETQRLAGLLTPADGQRVQEVNVRLKALVAAFAGAKPSSGYAITVREIALHRGTLRVVVARRSPRPGSYTLPAFTRPYHVVTIGAKAAAATRAWVLVTVSGHLLARGLR